MLNALASFCENCPKMTETSQSVPVVFCGNGKLDTLLLNPLEEKLYCELIHYYLLENQDRRELIVSHLQKKTPVRLHPGLDTEDTKLQQTWLHLFWFRGTQLVSLIMQTGACLPYAGSLWVLVLTFNTRPQALSNALHPNLVLNTETAFYFKVSSLHSSL